MGKVALEHVFTGPTTGITTYDANYTMLGNLLYQYSGVTSSDNYVSTVGSSITNILDIANTSYAFPFVYQWSSNIYWIFVGQNATAAVTRTIGLFEYNSTLNTTSWKGFITLQGTQIAGNKTIRGLRAAVYEHSTGTVSTAGASATITGSGTLFTSDRIAVGARIGFGSTDPTQISTWYEITAIASDTSLTIGNTVNLSAGTSYVIEEIRIYLAITNATLQNGGLFAIKGLNYTTFAIAGTTIVESTTVDNIRASYLLKDFAPATVTVTIASPGVFTLNNHGLRLNDAVFFTSGGLPTGIVAGTVYFVTSTSLTTNTFTVSATPGAAAINTSGVQSGIHTFHSAMTTISTGLAIKPQVSATEHNVYVLNAENATTAIRFVEMNLRAALTPNSASGATGSYVLRTALSNLTGTPTQINNGRLFSVQHGSASGITSVYFTTSTRVYRTSQSVILDNASNFISDQMIEIPPGGLGNAVYTLTNAMVSVDYSSTIDRLLITTSTGRFGTYTAQYNTSGSQQFDKLFGTNVNRYKLGITPAGTVDGVFPQATVTIWSEGGFFFVIPNVVTSGLNWLYIFPGAADGFYSSTSNQVVLTPKLATPNADSFYRCYVENVKYLGTYQLGFPPETYRIYFRTSGIDDNSGSWTEVPSGGDMSSFSPGSYIQFKLELDTLGEVCVPTRVYSIGLVYNDFTTDVHYQPSVKYSDYVNKRFAWWFALAWGSTVPTLRVRLYDADTNNLLVDDDTASPTGTFEKSTDGGSTWGAYNTTDRANSTTYIRYTPASLGDNIKVKFLLTQN